ncbi:cadherin-like domain-containing protein [Pseudomonas stutzeri]|nr:cadherin-like domain-containing protein [Stutzerimonas stutzeri]
MPLVTLAMLRLSPSTSLSLPSRSAALKVTGVSSVAARLSSPPGCRRWPAMLRLSPSTSLSLPSRSAALKVTGVSSVAARLSSLAMANDDSLAATEDTPVTFAAADLLGNDSDVDGDSLSIASVTSGTGGTSLTGATLTVTVAVLETRLPSVTV